MDIAESPFGRFIQKSFLNRLLMVCAVPLFVLGVVLPVVYFAARGPSVIAFALAWGICFGIGLFSLSAAELIRGEQAILVRFGFDMVVRMAILLSACFIVQHQSPELMSHGFVPWLAALNMVGLTLEVLVLIASMSSSSDGSVG